MLKVSTRWEFKDYLWAMLVRLGLRRMKYLVEPGLYAVGDPGKKSPVLVSANYGFSFNVLRRELAGLDAWILVLDTKGVNVWCAAGKGTFGTTELLNRINETQLANVVETRELIVPQLGAPGVSGHTVQAFSDFRVLFGPVRARDIKAYIAAGMKADADMRRVRFTALDRFAVSWLELVLAAKWGVLWTAVFWLSGVLYPAWKGLSLQLITVLWAAIVSGTVGTAVLLPWLPYKPFSVKGALLGLVAAGIFVHPFRPALVLLSAAISSYLALNLTGCSTYTSLSGVKKEIRLALPVIAGAVFVSAVLLIWKG